MPIPLMLVWFGVLESQNKALHLGGSLEIKLELQIQYHPNRVLNKNFFIEEVSAQQKFRLFPHI